MLEPEAVVWHDRLKHEACISDLLHGRDPLGDFV